MRLAKISGWKADVIVMAVCAAIGIVAGYVADAGLREAYRYQHALVCGATVTPDCKVGEPAVITSAHGYDRQMDHATCAVAVRAVSGKTYETSVGGSSDCNGAVGQRVTVFHLGNEVQAREFAMASPTDYHFDKVRGNTSYALLAGMAWLAAMGVILVSGRQFQLYSRGMCYTLGEYMASRYGMVILMVVLAVAVVSPLNHFAAEGRWAGWALPIVVAMSIMFVAYEYRVRFIVHRRKQA